MVLARYGTGAALRQNLSAALASLALALPVCAQGASLGQPVSNDDSKPQTGTASSVPALQPPQPEPKRGPVKGTNLPGTAAGIQTVKFQGDPLSDDREPHRPPDIGNPSPPGPDRSSAPSTKGGVTLGVPRSAGIGQSATEDSPEERYNWGAPGSIPARSADDPPARDPKPKGRLTNSARGGGSDDVDRLPSEPHPAPSAGGGWQFGDYAGICYDKVRKNVFASDREFDDFMPHTSNPLYAEDPRTQTELRPIFMYQKIPGSNYYYHGGDIENFALQARLAFGDRFSVVINQVGWLVINKGKDSVANGGNGFEEIHVGAKYTFLRDREDNWLAAGGLNFQIPTGPAQVYQNTGYLGISPYVTAAHKFWKSTYGTWGISDSLAFDFSVDRERNQFFVNSLHLDYDIACLHRFFPFIELNWFNYFSNGSANPLLGFGGGDLANVGSTLSGHNFVNLAVGSRFRLGPNTQMGVGVEFPMTGASKDLNNFRLTVDLIWRY